MKYNAPKVELVLVDEEDVIRTSELGGQGQWEGDDSYGTPL